MFAEEGSRVRDVGDVMSLLRVPRSTAYRFIKVLRDRGFLQDAPGRGNFELGPQVSVLSAAMENRFDLSRTVLPLLHEMVERTNETAFVGVRSGPLAICLDLVESPQSIRLYFRRGRRLPLYAGATAKVVLAHLSRKERERILSGPLHAFTELTVTDPEALRRQLDEIVANGYFISRGEREPGIHAVSVAAFRPSGKFLCALTVAGPGYRMPDDKIQECLAVAKDAAAKLTDEIARFDGQERPVPPRRSGQVLELRRKAG
ncbi:MAG: IclR family transcriptional regulator [Proteobacteria bacterium]|nr:IclR family transcriptional regulator [Pseudomonadota bacterium]